MGVLPGSVKQVMSISFHKGLVVFLATTVRDIYVSRGGGGEGGGVLVSRGCVEGKGLLVSGFQEGVWEGARG